MAPTDIAEMLSEVSVVGPFGVGWGLSATCGIAGVPVEVSVAPQPENSAEADSAAMPCRIWRRVIAFGAWGGNMGRPGRLFRYLIGTRKHGHIRYSLVLDNPVIL